MLDIIGVGRLSCSDPMLLGDTEQGISGRMLFSFVCLDSEYAITAQIIIISTFTVVYTS